MEKRASFTKELSKILLKNGAISDKDSATLQRSFAESSKGTFDEFLLDEGLVDKKDLLKALSQYYNVPAVDVDGFFFDPFLLHQIPKDVMIRHLFIPMEVDQNMMTVVANEPDEPLLLSIIGDYFTYDIRLLVGLRQDIINAIMEYYDPASTEDQPYEDRPTMAEQEEEFPISDEDIIDQ